MSRSYRKPYITDGYGGKRRQFYKRYANKKVRRTVVIANGGAYKKVSCSWDICDYKIYYSKWNSGSKWKYRRK